MQAKQEYLLDFVAECKGHFVIPPYQRKYSWDEARCNEFWRDIVRAGHANKAHFTGALLYKCEGEDLSIVDGQQRLTTVMILLSAYSAFLQDGKCENLSVDSEFISSNYLFFNEDSLKLIPSTYDYKAFDSVVKMRTERLVQFEQTNAGENFTNFYNKMQKEDFDPETLWRGLRNLVIVAVELGDSDNGQAIFESFNSKGVPLVTADLVRNYLLVSQSMDEQKRLYEEIWEPAASMFGDDP
ncbi:MAG: DUF262 domain-containing protein, partial [Coriobacteriales bacterium]|nr:DUF262 domain-containing protein [Coriobacteriales bacterium]